MFDYSPSLESPIKSEKKVLVLDSNLFQVCTINKTETGHFSKKRLVYAHHDGEKLNITLVNPGTNEVIGPKN